MRSRLTSSRGAASMPTSGTTSTPPSGTTARRSPSRPTTRARSTIWASCSTSATVPPRRCRCSIARSRLHLDEPEYHNNRGLALVALQREDEAIAEYRRALALAPAHTTAWNNLGLALQATGDVAAAIDAYRQGLRVAPGIPAAALEPGARAAAARGLRARLARIRVAPAVRRAVFASSAVRRTAVDRRRPRRTHAAADRGTGPGRHAADAALRARRRRSRRARDRRRPDAAARTRGDRAGRFGGLRRARAAAALRRARLAHVASGPARRHAGVGRDAWPLRSTRPAACPRSEGRGRARRRRRGEDRRRVVRRRRKHAERETQHGARRARAPARQSPAPAGSRSSGRRKRCPPPTRHTARGSPRCRCATTSTAWLRWRANSTS